MSKQDFKFKDIGSKPVPSILRNFSAPVKLQTDLADEDLAFLMVHDSDGFNKWEAGQTYAHRVISQMLEDDATEPPESFIDSIGDLIERALDPQSDKALMARALTLPSISEIGQQQKIVDPSAIARVRQSVQAAIKREHKSALLKLYKENTSSVLKLD